MCGVNSSCQHASGSKTECVRNIKPQLRSKISVYVLLALLYMSAKIGAIWTLRCAAPTSPKQPFDDFREVVEQVPDEPRPVKTGANA